ncbi:MAG: hypothetical protein OXG65_09080 [Chloroflexi bacterium]|nr:hypothetical protein [Chloroflexota bacterium]
MWSWTKYHGHGRKLRLDLDDFLDDRLYFLGDDLFDNLFDRDLDNLLDLNHLLDGNFLPHDVHDLLGHDSFNLLSNDLLYRDLLDDDPLDRDLFGHDLGLTAGCPERGASGSQGAGAHHPNKSTSTYAVHSAPPLLRTPHPVDPMASRGIDAASVRVGRSVVAARTTAVRCLPPVPSESQYRF